jgi:hypothetical protein
MKRAHLIFFFYLPLVLCAKAQSVLNEVSSPLALSISADFTGDGLPDFVTLSTPQNLPGQIGITTLIGRGDGFITGLKSSYFSIDSSIHISQPPAGQAADFNGDGKLDIAFAAEQNQQGLIFVAMGNGDGTFESPKPITLPSGIGSAKFLSIADFNKDNYPDLLFQDTSGNIVVLLGNGNGTFQPAVVTSASSLDASSSPILGISDINQDGFPDIVLGSSPSNNYYTALGNGKGGFGSAHAVDLSTIISTTTTIQFVGVHDFNGNQKPDLLFFSTIQDTQSSASTQTFNFVLLPGNGDGTFDAPQTQQVDIPATNYSNIPESYIASMMDLNQDGNEDVLLVAQVSNYVGEITCCATYLSAGKGDGTFIAPVALGSYSSAIPYGPPEIFVQQPSSTYTFLNFGNGHVGFVDGNGMLFLPENSGPGIALPSYYLIFGPGNYSQQSFEFAGTSDLMVSSVTTEPPFSVSNLTSFGSFNDVSMEFDVTRQGSSSGVFSINSNDALNPINVPAFAYVGTPGFSVSPAALNFGYVKYGTTSSLQVTVTDTSATPAVITQLALTGDTVFKQASTTCSGPITSSCTITITFSPSSGSPGPNAGNLLLTDQNGLVTTVSLQGDGYQVGPLVQLSPTSIAFGNQKVGTTSNQSSLSITDTGDAPLVIQSIATALPFAVESACSTIQPQDSCTVLITFSPTTPGSQSGTITLVDNAASGQQTAGLTGTGIGPVFIANPVAITFGNEVIGDAVPPQTVTLTNTGGAAGTASIVLSGGGAFTETNNCSGSIASGSNCSISVVFKPTVAGTQTATLTATDQDGLTTTVPIAGSAHLVPSFTASPASLDFGYQKVNLTSNPQQITLSNPTQHVVNATSISASGPFAQTNTCSGPLASGAACTISVTNTPLSTGAQTGYIAITDQYSQIVTVRLTGTGYSIGPIATITPLTLSFANQVINTTSAAQKVNVQNTGDIPLQVQSVAASTGFQESNTCSTLAPGASCSITVSFNPTSIGNQTGTLVITDNSSDSLQTIPLTGTGIPAPFAQLQVTPASLAFESQFLGSSSLPQTVTLLNTGTLPIQIQSVDIASPFGALNACGNSIAPGFSCGIGVFFQPAAIGSQTGTLTITDSAPDSPQTIQLNGTGATVSISLSNGSSTSATISQGGTATYNLALMAEDGFAGVLTVSCTGAPSGFQCLPSASSVSFTSAAPTANVTFTASSVKAKTSGLFPRSLLEGITVVALLFSIFPMPFRRRSCRLNRYVAFFSAFFLFIAISACGAGSSMNTSGGNTQTTYTLQAVFSTATGQVVQQPLTLTVVNSSD